jgi:BirA family transcriptional regulator, biotin operon repressor / biotin---[acetyl-CoA-carboxylase] ligase
MDLPVTRLDTVDSTNLYVKKGILEGRFSGTGVVVSRVQTAGLGRRGRPWHSANDFGLWATFYFTPGGRRIHDLVSAVSKAVSRALASRGLAARVKFPNDLLVGERKICGILAETMRQGDLAGVGVNLNQKVSDFPEEIRGIATSFLIEKGEPWPVNDFLDCLLTEFKGLKAAQEE